MKKTIAAFAVVGLVGVGALYSQHEQVLCDGIAEENDLNIPAFDGNGMVTTGNSEEEFMGAIDRFESVYGDIVASMGGQLQVNRDWANGTVNAYARRSGDTWIVHMYGGLARHETVTVDGFMMVICHEIGHHLGGAPKYAWGNAWASNEGQSDYFAGLKCLRKVWTEDENIQWARNNDVAEPAKLACDEAWSADADRARCYRISMAGQSLANLLATLGGAELPEFETPDDRVVSRTNDRHPAAQCRLDTYFQGGLCGVDSDVDVDQADAVVGTCNRAEGADMGVRPLCWYKPAVSSDTDADTILAAQ